MPLLSVNDDQAAANSRIAAIRLAGLTLRWMENWRRDVGSYDAAMILLAVVSISAGRLLRADVQSELRDMKEPFPGEDLAKCNISSIAAATGLNQETTRRKVQELVRIGKLVRLEDGTYQFPPGYLQQPRIAELVRDQLDCFTSVVNDLLRDGVYDY